MLEEDMLNGWRCWRMEDDPGGVKWSSRALCHLSLLLSTGKHYRESKINPELSSPLCLCLCKHSFDSVKNKFRFFI